MPTPHATALGRLRAIVERIATRPDDPQELRLQKTLLVASAGMMSMGGLTWGVFLLAFDEVAASPIPFGYTALTIVNIVVYRLLGNYPSFRWIQLLLTLMLPFLLGLAIGGYASSGAVVAWSLLAPMGALLFCTPRAATGWFAAFVGVLIVAALLETTVQAPNNLGGTPLTVFFAMNLGVPTMAAFVLLRHFVQQKDAAMTALQEASRELQEAQSQLVHSGKMASIGTLAAGVAHELNTPIASMTSSHDTLARAVKRLSKMLEEDGARARVKRLDAMLNAILGTSAVIGEAASRVDEISRRLRAFTHLDEAELKHVDINEGIRDTIALMGSELGETQVEIDLAKLPKIAVYPGALNQVFLNLLRNARQAVDAGGTIWVRSYMQDDTFVIEVRDDGRGIAADALPTIFEPKFTTKNNRVAASMGLSICERIMQQHQGTIRVDSEEGKGTTSTLGLPMDLERRLQGA